MQQIETEADQSPVQFSEIKQDNKSKKILLKSKITTKHKYTH